MKDVVAKAKAKGMKTSENNVYRIRRTLGGPSRDAGAKQASPVRRSAGLATDLRLSSEDLLCAVAAEMGLAKALEILQTERSRLRAWIGG